MPMICPSKLDQLNLTGPASPYFDMVPQPECPGLVFFLLVGLTRLCEGEYHGRQLPSAAREPVFRVRRVAVDETTFDNPRLLQIPERLGQRPRRYLAKRCADTAEPHARRLEGTCDGQRPFLQRDFFDPEALELLQQGGAGRRQLTTRARQYIFGPHRVSVTWIARNQPGVDQRRQRPPK